MPTKKTESSIEKHKARELVPSGLLPRETLGRVSLHFLQASELELSGESFADDSEEDVSTLAVSADRSVADMTADGRQIVASDPDDYGPGRDTEPEGGDGENGAGGDADHIVSVAAVPLPEISDRSTGLGPFGGDDRDTRIDLYAPDDGSAKTLPQKRRYEFKKLIGEGGMGEVWKVRQSSLRRNVAVKRVRPALIDELEYDPQRQRAMFDSFRREALITARLEHPNIVPIHELGEDPQGSPTLVMKQVEGELWSDKLTKDFETMSRMRFLRVHIPILMEVAQAVAFAHDRGVIHRDIKPGQVMLGSFGEVLLMDWGLAIYIGEANALESQSDFEWLPTRASCVNPAGTPSLMAPEQTRLNANAVGPWTDVYLLGATLYFLLAGRFPHDQENAQASFAHAQRGEVEPLGTVYRGRKIPESLVDLVNRSLVADHRERLGSAATFAAELEAFLSGTALQAEANRLLDAAEHLLYPGDSHESLLDPNEALEEALRHIQSAEHKWNGLARTEELFQATTQRHAHLALERGDLKLAEIRAQAISDDTLRGAMLGRIERASYRIERSSSIRRALSAAVLILLLTVTIGAVVGMLHFQDLHAEMLQSFDEVDRQRDTALRERSRAMRGRQLAERNRREALRHLVDNGELITFLLDETRGRLDLTREADMAASAVIAEGVHSYFEDFELTGLSPDLRLQEAALFTEVGNRFITMGELQRGVEMIDRAIEVFDDLGQSRSPFAMQARLSKMAGEYRINGKIGDLSQLDEILDWLESDDGEFDSAVASVATSFAVVLSYAQEMERAESLARTVIESLETNDEDSALGLSGIAHGIIGNAALTRRDVDLASSATAKAIELIRRSEVELYQARLPTLLQRLGHAKLLGGQGDEALRYYREAYDESVARVGEDHRDSVIYALTIHESALRLGGDLDPDAFERDVDRLAGLFGDSYPMVLVYRARHLNSLAKAEQSGRVVPTLLSWRNDLFAGEPATVARIAGELVTVMVSLVEAGDITTTRQLVSAIDTMRQAWPAEGGDEFVAIFGLMRAMVADATNGSASGEFATLRPALDDFIATYGAQAPVARTLTAFLAKLDSAEGEEAPMGEPATNE